MTTPSDPAAPGRWAILSHDLPDGSRHFDLLIQPPGSPAGARLRSWRCPLRPDPAGDAHTQMVDSMPDHRAAYLTIQGPISGGRGTVLRVAEGLVRAWEMGEGRVTGLMIPETGDSWRLLLVQVGDGWRLTCARVSRAESLEKS